MALLIYSIFTFRVVVNIGSPVKLTPGINRNIEYSNSITEFPSAKTWSGVRDFSSKSMRSKVERRMQKESGKTLREVRRASKLRRKLMTDEERLLYNLRRVCCYFNFPLWFSLLKVC